MKNDQADLQAPSQQLAMKDQKTFAAKRFRGVFGMHKSHKDKGFNNLVYVMFNKFNF